MTRRRLADWALLPFGVLGFVFCLGMNPAYAGSSATCTPSATLHTYNSVFQNEPVPAAAATRFLCRTTAPASCKSRCCRRIASSRVFESREAAPLQAGDLAPIALVAATAGPPATPEQSAAAVYRRQQHPAASRAERPAGARQAHVHHRGVRQWQRARRGVGAGDGSGGRYADRDVGLHRTGGVDLPVLHVVSAGRPDKRAAPRCSRRSRASISKESRSNSRRGKARHRKHPRQTCRSRSSRTVIRRFSNASRSAGGRSSTRSI